MRVAVVDIGSNSTRLLIADANRGGSIKELLRRSEVTRLGDGVDAHGALSQQAIERVLRTLADYRREIDRHRCEANFAVLTAAVREAANGAQFAARVREQFALDAHVLSGDEEAQLTFLGAMSDERLERRASASEPVVVIDIGGGSTEFVVGHDRHIPRLRPLILNRMGSSVPSTRRPKASARMEGTIIRYRIAQGFKQASPHVGLSPT